MRRFLFFRAKAGAPGEVGVEGDLERNKEMNFKFKCPQCGQEIEADESFRGQVAPCPFCEKNIVIPKAKPQVIVSKPKSKQTVTWKRNQPSISQETSGYAPMGGLSNTEPPRRGFLSPRGRASRRQFLIINGVAVLLAFFNYLEKQGLVHFASFIRMLLIPLAVLVVVFGWCLWTRRLHDLNRSDYWLLPFIAGEITCGVLGAGQISVILMFLLWLSWSIVLGSLDGTPGDNDYGHDPKGRVGTGEQAKTSKIAIWILSAVSALVSVVAIAARNLMPVTTLQEEMVPRELRQSESDEKEGKSSSEDVDMVKVGGVLIRRLSGDEFKKITGEDGDEMYVATLPEKDGFISFVGIESQRFDFSSMPITLQQMRNFTPQDIEEFMDGYIPSVAETIKKEQKEQGAEVDVIITERSGNTVTFLMDFKTHYACQKRMLDTRNGRDLLVTGAWKSSQDKSIVQACVDSARLATP